MITGYGMLSAKEAERLLYAELIADLYHAIDAIKDPVNKRPLGQPQSYWIKEIEKILEQLGSPRPRVRRAGPHQ